MTWNKTSESLPKEGEIVLGYGDGYYIIVKRVSKETIKKYYKDSYEFMFECVISGVSQPEITHWKYLQSPNVKVDYKKQLKDKDKKIEELNEVIEYLEMEIEALER